MFENLYAILVHKGISLKQYAEILGVEEKIIQKKIAGKTDFTYPEFKKTCSLLYEYNADYLFIDNTSKTPAEDDLFV